MRERFELQDAIDGSDQPQVEVPNLSYIFVYVYKYILSFVIYGAPTGWLEAPAPSVTCISHVLCHIYGVSVQEVYHRRFLYLTETESLEPTFLEGQEGGIKYSICGNAIMIPLT